MLLVCLLLLALVCSPCAGTTEVSPPDRERDEEDTCQTLKQEAQQIRREGYTAIDKADTIREQAYRVKDEAFELKEEAYEIKESALEAKSELETMLVETIASVRSQSTVTNLYIQEIRSTLSGMKEKMEKMEEKLEDIEGRIGEQDSRGDERFTALTKQSQTIEKKISEQAAVSSTISSHLTETLTTTQTVKERQEAQMSEIRLISLYKMTGQTNTHSGTYDSDLAVDGMITFDTHHWADMRTYSHTTNTSPGNKLWLSLGGLFRIHKIKIWNLRHCCQERLIGAHIYADDRLVGTVIRAQGSYDFDIGEEEAIYAKDVTLQQPLGQHLHIIELQVWGTGPYSEDDKFA